MPPRLNRAPEGTLERDLEDDFDIDPASHGNGDLARLIIAGARALWHDTDPEVAQGGQVLAKAQDIHLDDTDPGIARGEQVLAKAQDVIHRMGTPEDVLARAQKVMVNPVDIGIVSGFLAVGTQESFSKALSLVTEQEDRNARAHAETALDGVLDDFDRAEDAQSLRDELNDLRQQVATLTGRVAGLESNTALATVASIPQQLVAKGYEHTSSSVAKNDAASLLSRGQGVIDSVSTIGVLSSLISEGKLGEARAMVEAAELDHDAQVKAAERKRLR